MMNYFFFFLLFFNKTNMSILLQSKYIPLSLMFIHNVHIVTASPVHHLCIFALNEQVPASISAIKAQIGVVVMAFTVSQDRRQ